MNIRKTTIVQLTRHLACVSRVDQYSQFLVRELEDTESFSLSISGSEESYLCSVRNEDKHTGLVFNISKKGNRTITFPSFFPRLFRDRKRELVIRTLNSSEISSTVGEKELTTLLALINRSFDYRSIAAPSDRPEILQLLKYWWFYLTRKSQRRSV
ncbi:MAG: hypothetical protein PQJ47_03235 [Sphaerochaetaceae bacterium]|nr:hypothetical protein [Sphaerochaetaceae bacterium]